MASEHHDVYPATDVRNSHDSDVRFGGQYGAWSGGGGAGSGHGSVRRKIFWLNTRIAIYEN